MATNAAAMTGGDSLFVALSAHGVFSKLQRLAERALPVLVVSVGPGSACLLVSILVSNVSLNYMEVEQIALPVASGLDTLSTNVMGCHRLPTTRTAA